MEIDKTFPTFKKIYHDLINTFSNINTYKEIFLYLLRVLGYLILYMIFVIAIINAPICVPIVEKIFDYMTKDMNPFEAVGIYVFLTIPLCSYLSAKICGLFKKINNLNIFFAIIIMILIDIVWSYCFDTNNYKVCLFFTTFNFIVFKFFNFLAKKLPMPFERIGYYTSIEFIKEAIKFSRKKENQRFTFS